MDYHKEFKERFGYDERLTQYTPAILAFVDQEKEESYAEGFGDGRTQERAALASKVENIKSGDWKAIKNVILTYLREPDASQGDKRTGQWCTICGAFYINPLADMCTRCFEEA